MLKIVSFKVAALMLFGSVAAADDLEFILSNESSVSLTGFYVSSASTIAWEENLLSGDRLAAGDDIDVTIADGLLTCSYDIRGVFSDGSTAEDYDVNLCDLGEYTYGD
ncbi:hypothetical protein [uncultured Ruegeria sp.]|uniref:hypothetical protein n=1 Tax=uncultured Ruegeria sp. TaxID=259304 RepID=UPI0026333D7A|nr:hypothetical protein [uncultured Ruegeria sp.]